MGQLENSKAMDNCSYAGLHCFHNCFWQNSRGKCKPDVQRNILLVRKERQQAPPSQPTLSRPQPLPGAVCGGRASAGVAAALFPGTLQAGETYGNMLLLLLGKWGAMGLCNEPRA